MESDGNRVFLEVMRVLLCACFLACLLSCLLACLLACLLVCLFVCLFELSVFFLYFYCLFVFERLFDCLIGFAAALSAAVCWDVPLRSHLQSSCIQCSRGGGLTSVTFPVLAATSLSRKELSAGLRSM